MRPPKGGVASCKHQRCWPPVHWLPGLVCVLSARHSTHVQTDCAILSSIWCGRYYSTAAFIKGRREPLATTSAAWFPMRDPSQAPSRDRLSVSSVKHLVTSSVLKW